MTVTHENVDRSEIKRASSDRSFGFVFAAVFAIVAFWPLIKGSGPQLGTLALAALFLMIAVVRPRLLAPLNWLWFKVGVVLHHVVTPIVMGAIFVLGVLPTALIKGTRRGDPLRVDPRRRGKSNWVVRIPPGPSPDTMRHLF